MRRPRLRVLTIAGLSLLGCSSSPLSRVKSDALEDFCSGGSPKAVINGVASKPKVTGVIEIAKCCQAASFIVSTASFDYKVRAGWEVESVRGPLPAKIDLAHPSAGWSSSIELTCSSDEVCYPPPDAYDSGMQGWLEVASIGEGVSSLGFLMSICLQVAEAPESPHPLLHNFELFAPDISATQLR
jgi:hypothetical protein